MINLPTVQGNYRNATISLENAIQQIESSLRSCGVIIPPKVHPEAADKSSDYFEKLTAHLDKLHGIVKERSGQKTGQVEQAVSSDANLQA